MIAIFFAMLGVVLMGLQWRAEPRFFRLKAEVAGPDALVIEPDPVTPA